MQLEKKVTSFGVAMTLIGTMIGAGFASGQELLQFFGGFGLQGFMGIFISGIMYAVYAALIMLLARQLQTDNYNALIIPGQNKIFKVIVDTLMAFLLFGMFTAMVVGSSALLQEQFGLPLIVGALIMVIISILTVYWGSDSLVASFNIVVPVMIIFAVIISIVSLSKAPSIELYDRTGTILPNSMVGNWFLSSLLFVFYSMLGAVGSLPALGVKLKSNKDAIIGSLLGAAILGGMALLLYVAAMSNVDEIAGTAMPMMILASQIGSVAGIFYTIVLFAAIYTTAAGALFGIKARIDNIQSFTAQKRSIIIVVVAALALPATKVGFVNLVGFLYPLYGYMGIFIFISMIVNFILTRNKNMKPAPQLKE